MTKQQRNRVWLARFAMLIGFGFLVYIGYCWGLWGRHSLLLQYLFQCSCPAASTEARYPDEVEVIVPACQYVSSILTPSGRIMYVQEISGNSNSTYLLNLQSQEKIPFFIPEGSPRFLTDDLLFLWVDCGKGYECGYFILDRNTGKQYPIRNFVFLQPDAYTYNLVSVEILADYLREAENVFLIDDDIIVAIVSDFRTSPERNFFVVQGAFAGYDSDRVKRFLRNNNINYIYVPDRFPDEALSPDGRFIARSDGIYVATTNQKIVEEYSSSKYYQSSRGYFQVRGWTYDNTGVIYSTFQPPCLFKKISLGVDETGCFKMVSQPLLKLKVPDKYLLPTQSP